MNKICIIKRTNMAISKDVKIGYIAMAVVSFFWGTTYIASRIGAQQMPGIFLAGLRQISSGIIMVAFFMAKGYRLPSISDFKKITVQAILLICIANGLLTWSLEYIGGGLAAVIAALVPLFVTLFSIWFAKSGRVTRWMFIGLLLGFAGVFTIFYDYIGSSTSPYFIVGILMAVFSTISWAAGTVYASGKKLSVELLFGVGLQMLIAGVILLLVSFITGRYSNPVNFSASAWYALAYLVSFGSILAYSAYVIAIKKLPATLASLYAYINPIVAVICGWLLLNEKLSLSMALGTLITISGVYIVNREFKSQKKAKETITENKEPPRIVVSKKMGEGALCD